MSNRQLYLRRLLVAIVFLFLWELVAGGIHPSLQMVDPFYTSSPSRIAFELYTLFASGQVMEDIGVTVMEALYGLVIGIATGVLVGLAFAYSPSLSALLEPLMSALNSIPRPALAPLAIFWFGIGLASKVFLAWSIVFFVIFYNTYLGVKGIDPDLLHTVRVMGASRLKAIRLVVLPAVASWIFAALRLSVSYALIGAIIGEFVGATSGIGYQMIYAEGLLLTDRLYALVLIVAAVGLAMVEAAKLVERRMLKWRVEARLY